MTFLDGENSVEHDAPFVTPTFACRTSFSVCFFSRLMSIHYTKRLDDVLTRYTCCTALVCRETVNLFTTSFENLAGVDSTAYVFGLPKLWKRNALGPEDQKVFPSAVDDILKMNVLHKHPTRLSHTNMRTQLAHRHNFYLPPVVNANHSSAIFVCNRIQPPLSLHCKTLNRSTQNRTPIYSTRLHASFTSPARLQATADSSTHKRSRGPQHNSLPAHNILLYTAPAS